MMTAETIIEMERTCTRDSTHELQGQEDAPSEAECDAQKSNPVALGSRENGIRYSPEPKNTKDCRPHKLRHPHLSIIIRPHLLQLLLLL